MIPQAIAEQDHPEHDDRIATLHARRTHAHEHAGFQGHHDQPPLIFWAGPHRPSFLPSMKKSET
jgi:hypothetical protein